MRQIRLIQKPLSELIKVVFVQHPIDLGKFTVRLLNDILPSIKKELELDFDRIDIYPGPQPRGTGDIELFKGDKLVGRISVKTAVSGDLKIALRKIWRDLEKGKDGIILYFVTGERQDSSEEELKLIIIYLQSTVIAYKRTQVYFEIQDKLEEKAKNENYKKLMPLAVNEAIMFENLYRTLVMEEKVNKAYEEAKRAKAAIKEAYNEAKSARETAEKAYEEAKSAKETAKRAYEEANSAREMAEKAYREIQSIKSILRELKEKLLK